MHEECLPAKRNSLTAYVAHVADVPAHTPLFPVRVQGRIASDHPQEDLVVQVNEGEEDRQEVWSPSRHEMGVRAGVQSEAMSPLDCVHEGRENVMDNRVAAKDVRGTRDVLDALVHVPIHGDVREVARDDPMPCHALREVPHEGN